MNNRLQPVLLPALGKLFLLSSGVGPLAVAVGRGGFLPIAYALSTRALAGLTARTQWAILPHWTGGDGGRPYLGRQEGWGLEPEQKERFTGRVLWGNT